MLDLKNKQHIPTKAPNFYQKNQRTLTYLVGAAMVALMVGFIFNPFKVPKAFKAPPPQDAAPLALNALAYADAIAAIHNERRALTLQYVNAPDQAGRDAALNDARQAFEAAIIDTLLPLWLEAGGLPPGADVIEDMPTHHLLLTLIRDAGINLPLPDLSDLPPDGLMKILTPKGALPRPAGEDHTSFMEAAERLDEGLYLLSFDDSLALLHQGREGLTLIHASTQPARHLRLDAARSVSALTSAKTRALSPLTGHASFIKRWLNQAPIEVDIQPSSSATPR